MVDRVRLFTFKEGLFARLAHDLRLHVERFWIVHGNDEIFAKFDSSSIFVDGVMVDERCDRDVLGLDDRVKIVETIRGPILNVARHPTIAFRGRLLERGNGAVQVSGELRMLGVTQQIVFTASRREGRVFATFALRPSEFGIPPFKALAGAIRLQDRVLVELDLDEALNSSTE